MNICNFVRFDTRVLVIFEFFWGLMALEIFQKLLLNHLNSLPSGLRQTDDL